MLDDILSTDNRSLLIGLAVAIIVIQLFTGTKRPKWRKGSKAWRRSDAGFRKEFRAVPLRMNGQRDMPDAAEQLRRVMTADFKARPLLNKGEAAVFKALDAAVVARNSGWQVMAQVNLGEFLSSQDKSAFFSINSKRVDFALMDENCCIRHALEYQGSGHHVAGNTAAARDAVKKEALRKAGIGYHEVVAGHTTPSELRALVEKLVPGG